MRAKYCPLVLYKSNGKRYLGFVSKTNGKLTYTTSTNCLLSQNADNIHYLIKRLENASEVIWFCIAQLNDWPENENRAAKKLVAESNTYVYIGGDEPWFVTKSNNPVSLTRLGGSKRSEVILFNDLYKDNAVSSKNFLTQLGNENYVYLDGTMSKYTAFTNPDYYIQLYANAFQYTIIDKESFKRTNVPLVEKMTEQDEEETFPQVFMVKKGQELGDNTLWLKNFLSSYENPSDEFLEMLNDFGCGKIEMDDFIKGFKKLWKKK